MIGNCLTRYNNLMLIIYIMFYRLYYTVIMLIALIINKLIICSIGYCQCVSTIFTLQTGGDFCASPVMVIGDPALKFSPNSGKHFAI